MVRRIDIVSILRIICTRGKDSVFVVLDDLNSLPFQDRQGQTLWLPWYTVFPCNISS
jgi:hypothetical protein